MEFRVLDENFNQVHILDDFKSAIWTDRFYEAGDFTIKLSLTGRNQFEIHIGRYVWNSMSNRIMMIEKIVIESSSDEGSDHDYFRTQSGVPHGSTDRLGHA